MAVQFDDKRIIIFGDGLFYASYYFAIATEYTDLDYATVVKRVLEQWAYAIAVIPDNHTPVFLPFSFGDENAECFAATLKGDQIALRIVEVDVEGYSLNLFHLHDFMASSHKVLQQYPEDFGVYDKSELVEALKKAEHIAI